MFKKNKKITPERIDALDKKNGFPRSWNYHHIYRYNLAKKYCKDKIVLDVGCGYGYGTFMLSKICKNIVGIDISNKTIDIAKKKYSSKNTKFLNMDAEKIKLNQLFDIIVSFENIEHLKKPRTFLDEIKKIIIKNGFLIISTPNAKYVSKNNPYHKKDFSLEELKIIINEKFSIKKIEGEFLMPFFSWKIIRIFWFGLEKIIPSITLIPTYLGKFFPSKSFTLILICKNDKIN